MARTLNDQQKLFLEVLFEEAKGNVVLAKKLAGYSESYPTSQVVKTLEEEIVQATKQFLSRNGPKAALSLVGVLDDPSELGVKEKLTAAKDILDRIGVSKTEKIDIASNGIFLLPTKREEDA
jgi:mevalonate kinase